MVIRKELSEPPACEVVVGVVATAMQTQASELMEKEVEEDDTWGKQHRVPYVLSTSFVNQLLDIVCTSSNLATMRLHKGWLGGATYEYDNVPSYAQKRSVDPSLKRACEVMTRDDPAREVLRHTLQLLAPDYTPAGVAALACSRSLTVCSYKRSMVARWLTRMKELILEPIILLKAMPLLVIGVAFLIITMLSVREFVLTSEIVDSLNGPDTDDTNPAASSGESEHQKQKVL
eukprot:jgi/Mesen1/2700/ME000167S01855